MFASDSFDLAPYQQDDLELLRRWIRTKEDALLWSGHQCELPLTQLQITKFQLPSECSPYMIRQGESKIGYIELHKKGPKHLHLARVLIGEQGQRGRGVGKMVLHMISRWAFNHAGLKLLTLNVYENNLAALKCYQNVGFFVKSKKDSGNPEFGNILHMGLCRGPELADKIVSR